MTAESHSIRKLTIDPGLFMLPGGSKKDRQRLIERAERAEREGLVTIVDVEPGTSVKQSVTSRRRRTRA